MNKFTNVCQRGNGRVCFLTQKNKHAIPNKILTTGAISKPKTATKFDSAAGNVIIGTNITINEKTKHPLQMIANLDKNAKKGLKRRMDRPVF